MTHKKFDTINNLFPEGQTVSAVGIKDYLDWAAHPEEYPKILAIPPIQRSFVWKPKQIQDLWDSLLRGMPIGSILLKSFESHENSAGLISTERKLYLSQKPGFHLMDGQQRTLSMLLGFPDSSRAEHKLWVDFSKSGTNGSVFRFRVSTPAQPFGYRLDGRRLSMLDRRTARQQWAESDQKKNEMGNREIFNEAKPWKEGGKNQNVVV
ncbi:DUF262 domain-containing protein [Methylobacter tundripaludum]|uniref:DUF262 domain-containing protein n=1 Tax=Methylobacter tundripaludum TaxID=173365 RepID=UPI001378F65E|nr:DUF262 domain-containing protein [Methylobacter tundripaludum]